MTPKTAEDKNSMEGDALTKCLLYVVKIILLAVFLYPTWKHQGGPYLAGL
jgi:hypothetical protein